MTQPEFSEEDLRRLEAEMERITVDDVLIQTTVTLLNLAARKAGLAAPPGQGPAPDWEEVRQAIEGARALMPLLEARHGDQLGQVRQTLSQLQMIYAQQAGGARRGRARGRRHAAGGRAGSGAAPARGAGPGPVVRAPVDPGPISALPPYQPIDCATVRRRPFLRPPSFVFSLTLF